MAEVLGIPERVIGPEAGELDCALVIIRGDPALPGFQRVLGISRPVRPNSFVEAQGLVIAWLGPDEWLVVGAPGQEKQLCSGLELALEGTHHAVVDVSGSRTIFRLSGPSAREIVSAGSSVDFHPRVFGPGLCVQSSFGRTGALILMRDDKPTFDVVVRRAYTIYVRDWLCSAVRAIGNSASCKAQ